MGKGKHDPEKRDRLRLWMEAAVDVQVIRSLAAEHFGTEQYEDLDAGQLEFLRNHVLKHVRDEDQELDWEKDGCHDITNDPKWAWLMEIHERERQRRKDAE